MACLQTVFNVLIRFETELGSAVDTRLQAECNLSLSQLAPMQVIARQGRCRVHDIADELSMSAGGTSKLVDCIEASGYCARSLTRRTDVRTHASREAGANPGHGGVRGRTA
jgi:MarR family transcriptional regulator, organic hydroperoxide resistance regulator